MEYSFLPELLLRAPYYSFNSYDLDRVPEILESIIFRNALWLASRGFYGVLEKKNFRFAELTAKECFTLSKYYNRMCFRPTPFGSFASFSTLNWNNGENLKLAGGEGAWLHLLPDQQLVHELSALIPDDALTHLYLNPTLYRLGKQLRYIKSVPDKNGKLIFSLSAIPAVKFNNSLVSIIAQKGIAVQDLVARITDLTGCELKASHEYLDFLLEEQVLFGPSKKGPLQPVLNADSLKVLPEIASFFAKWDLGNLSTSRSLPNAAAELEQILQRNKTGVPKNYFYAALEKTVISGGPGMDVQQDLIAAAIFLKKITPPRSSSALVNFVREFKRRYDLQKIPLLLALDPDSGISFDGINTTIDETLLSDIDFSSPLAGKAENEWSNLHRVLFKYWNEGRRNGEFSHLIINTEEVLYSAPKEQNSRDTNMCVVFRQTEDNLLIEQALSSPIVMPGRFSAFSGEVHSICKKIADAEESANPDVIFADLDQRSDSHVDNINIRKPVYSYVIPINTYPPLPNVSTIFLADLLLSVENDSLILESASLRKRVVPRLTTAYNYINNNLSIFRLLCELQFQHIPQVFNLDLEYYFPGLDFYPRIIAGKTIFSLAKWHVGAEALDTLSEKGDTLQLLREFRMRLHLPQRISMGSSDQQLIFDLASKSECDFFLQCISGLKKITLYEYLLPGRTVKVGNKPMAGQFVGFLLGTGKSYSAMPFRKIINKHPQRQFILGSKWIYIKLYCSFTSADLLLITVVRPVLNALKDLIETWFFVRYHDPDEHLRLRICCPESKIGQILSAIKDQIKSSGTDSLVKLYQADTYRREIERYGKRFINPSEDIFASGSNLILVWLTSKDIKSDIDRFLLGIWSASMMIYSFLNKLDALSFTAEIVESFMIEFSISKKAKLEMDKKYRSLTVPINQIVMQKSPGNGIVLKKASEVFRLKIENIVLISANKPINVIKKLLADLVHMQMNRNFNHDQRRHEFLVYYCLHKHFRSIVGKEK